ncbi:hypothetical protein PDIG_37570 [Penicillium digitatum PHI26]|uniref:FAD-binding domain-containing protein n=2 Tax=Penicillium digitatum TaxID=36651 RepID=K9GFL3_PEND2|nr:hypothetical protein PDIP_84160 [Penicillium digitatum Pd1]EKV05242.1 hypothetical protein PDIP_84160 [Penicillium digitatum Pd1]EKV13568.1 hypothetical protein PDIG_37570 [Penicillium digitatum PHI26]
MAPFLANSQNTIGETRTNQVSVNTAADDVANTAQHTYSNQVEDHAIDTEFLIVGAGPAGAALACFLGSYGLKGIMISSASGTVNTPRAHITNMAALVLEPVLVRHAALKGFKCRFHTTLLSFSNDEKTGFIIASIRDEISTHEYRIRTKYLLGADGARSQVVKELNLPLAVLPGQGSAINVLVKAEISHLVKNRTGNLHWVMQPDRDHPNFGWMAIVRMVKPWNEWMFILFPDRSYDRSQSKPSMEEYQKRVQEFIGDDTPVEILDISFWHINETVAEKYSEGKIDPAFSFCLGDAVHRHPPLNGLGSNTCIQDAFNLAWKLAYVCQGLASPSLLSTYSSERQPVGHSVVTRANQAFRDHFHVWDALGMLPADVSDRKQMLEELKSATPQGSNRRRALREAIKHTSHEFHGLGVEMNQHYEGRGIYSTDEAQPYRQFGRAAEDKVLYHEPSTYPGSRLPHVWLNKATPEKPISTIDLAGHGLFTLLTGIGGEAWKEAAGTVAKKLKIPIQACSIGFRQDWEDVYFEWETVRGVEESGAVLVRPDRFIAWRALKALQDSTACERKLLTVMRSVLGFENL